ncbi:uncharacterized protein LOC144262745 isoform X2 [Eretmochelys imbricata]
MMPCLQQAKETGPFLISSWDLFPWRENELHPLCSEYETSAVTAAVAGQRWGPIHLSGPCETCHRQLLIRFSTERNPGLWQLIPDWSMQVKGMKDRGHNRDPKQCRMKLKELRQAYQKTREANGCSGSEPQTCHFYDELHAILGGSATTTPAVLFDSFNGDGGNTEAGFGDKEEDDDDDEVVDSSQQASGETGFPDSQELFLTLDLEPVPPEPTQGCLLDPAGGEGTSAACVSMVTGSSPSQRLVKIRKKKKMHSR